MFNPKLVRHILRMGKRNIGCAYREFGLVKVALVSGMYLWMFLMHVGMRLDRIFFPGVKNIKVEKPVFIIGTGRTGSTFLYRLLNSENDYVASRFWHILVPCLTFKGIFWPLVRLLDPKLIYTPETDPDYEVFSEEEGHETTLTSLEEDEMVLGHIMDTQHLSYSMPLGLHPEGFDEIVYHDKQAHRFASAEFLKAYLQRQIFFLGKTQVISKAIFSTFRLKTLLAVFPDAKFIHLVRSPLESIPSHMTLHKRVTEKFNPGMSRQGIANFLMHRYRYNCESLLQFEQLLAQGVIDESRFLEVRYEDLRNDLEATMQRIVTFTGIDVSPALRKRWKKQAARQKSYRRKHVNLSLQALGLSEEKIRRDLQPIFAKYGF